MNWYELFFALICMHFLLDYPLQGDFIGKFKNRHMNTGQVGVPWWHLMTAHAFIQGGGVFLLTGNVAYGIVETILHFYIDVQKCEGRTSIHTDQFLHIACKAAYVAIMMYRGQIG